MEGAMVFGIVGGTPEAPAVAYLSEPQPVTPEVMALTQPVAPTPCAEHKCLHFDGSSCRLIKRIVGALPTVEEKLPPCRLRPTCRWWAQEGMQACLRCPQIVTADYRSSEPLRLVATPVIDPAV
jgi:hypothetical protein